MTDKLAMALSKVLFQHEPALLEADMEATARAVTEMSILLGCLMATVLLKAPTNYDEILSMVLFTINDSAEKTVKKVDDIIPNTTPQ